MEMKKISKILMIVIVLAMPVIAFMPGIKANGKASEKPQATISTFEQAVEIIKKYETLHQPRHWPLVGYGHLVQKGEKYSRSKALSEKEADALLRKDLLKNCAVFRSFGKDSLLLGVLAYNIGSGATLKSSVVKKLKAGDRNIRDSYLAHCRYRGKVHKGIQKRRIEEFDLLFDKEDVTKIKRIADDTTFAVDESMIACLLRPVREIFTNRGTTPFGRLLAGIITPTSWLRWPSSTGLLKMKPFETNTTACVFTL